MEQFMYVLYKILHCDKHNNVECGDDDILVNHVFTVCENFIRGITRIYPVFFFLYRKSLLQTNCVRKEYKFLSDKKKYNNKNITRNKYTSYI